MKKLLIIFMLMTFTLAGALFVCNKADEKIAQTLSYSKMRPVIVIDAGHGGVDVGTVGVDGCNEKEINLSIALNLYDFLSVCGYDCKLTRAGDYEVFNENEKRERSDLYNRMDYINSFQNCVMISIHQNHFENEAEHGAQIWYSPNDDKSKLIADSILHSIKNNLQPDNQRVNKESDSSYYLLHKACNPSVMIECGFMSNREENSKLQDLEYQKDLSYSIIYGLSEEV